MQHKVRRITIFVLNILGALSTSAGAIGILFGGIVFPPGLLQGSPFSDFTIPGLALGVIVGGGFVIAAATILTRHEVGVLTSALAGLFMIGFEVVEIVVTDRSWGDAFFIAVSLQAFFIALGLAVFGLAASLWRTEYRGLHFSARHLRHA